MAKRQLATAAAAPKMVYPAYVTDAPVTEVSSTGNGVRVASEVSLLFFILFISKVSFFFLNNGLTLTLSFILWFLSLSHAGIVWYYRLLTVRRLLLVCGSMQAAGMRLPRTMVLLISWSIWLLKVPSLVLSNN